VEAFQKIGVSQVMLEKRLGYKIETCIPIDLINLRKIFKSIQDGMSTIEDWFGDKSQTAAPQSQTPSPDQQAPDFSAPQEEPSIPASQRKSPVRETTPTEEPPMPDAPTETQSVGSPSSRPQSSNSQAGTEADAPLADDDPRNKLRLMTKDKTYGPVIMRLTDKMTGLPTYIDKALKAKDGDSAQAIIDMIEREFEEQNGK
jgi:hypothetical protein